jgi:polyhydroxybutyrate depolymerase
MAHMVIARRPATVSPAVAVMLATLLMVVLAATTACQSRNATPTASGTAPVGSSTHPITVDGRSRTYIVYRPAGLPASPVPLVVMLHGGFGTAEQAQSYYGWNAEADANHFAVVYPDGIKAAWNAGGGCCGVPATSDIDDVAFISQVVHAVSAELPIDPNRVYATGISNGGIMDYRLACETTLFAAIGPDSATLLGDCKAPHPISLIHIHGTADTRIPYRGGQGDGYAKINGPAVPDVVARWRSIDGCQAPTQTTAGPVATSTAACPDGRSVTLIAIEAAGHQWPGSPDRPLLEQAAQIDPPSTALNATDTIWRFFAAHPRPA